MKLAFIFLLAAAVSSKRVLGNLQLSSENTEQYIAKFSLQEGAHGLIIANFSVSSAQYFDSNPHIMKLSLFSDEEWGKFQKMMTEGNRKQSDTKQTTHRV